MASMIVSSKNLAKNCEFEEIEVSEVNGEFLMSLMEELQDHCVDESDEERLNCMIRSLETEINSSSFVCDDQDSSVDSYHQSISDGEESDQSMDGCDFSASFDDLDMSVWIDSEAVPCSPIYEFNYGYDFDLFSDRY